MKRHLNVGETKRICVSSFIQISVKPRLVSGKLSREVRSNPVGPSRHIYVFLEVLFRWCMLYWCLKISLSPSCNSKRSFQSTRLAVSSHIHSPNVDCCLWWQQRSLQIWSHIHIRHRICSKTRGNSINIKRGQKRFLTATWDCSHGATC